MTEFHSNLLAYSLTAFYIIVAALSYYFMRKEPDNAQYRSVSTVSILMLLFTFIFMY